MTIEAHFRETLRTHRPDLDDDEIRRRSLETLARDGHPADPIRPVPARVLGRDAATDHDRAGARARAEGPDRRRADDRARRDRRGADPRDPRRPAAQLRHGDPPDHPQPRDRRRGLRPGRGHVRGARSSRRATPARSSPSRPIRTPASCCARRSRSRRPASLHPRRSAEPDRPAAGLPLPPALPDAMRVCATQRHPIEVRPRPGSASQCWLHGPEDEIPRGRRREPLEREEFPEAEEA